MKTILSLTLSGSALALILLLMKALFGKKLSTTAYYYAWLVVLLRFLLPLPGLIPTGQVANGAGEPVKGAVIVSHRPEAPGEARTEGGDYRNFWASTTGQILSSDSGAAQDAQAPAKKGISVLWKDTRLWLALWGAGAMISFVLYIHSYMRFRKSLLRGEQMPGEADLRVYQSLPGRKPALRRCASIQTPMMLGVFRPRILLPDITYDDAVLRNILRHELMHYRRADTLFKWLAVVVYAVQWFNPLMLILRTEISRACELSCDEMVLRKMDDTGRRAYGETLLSLASGAVLPAGIVATTFATEKKTLKERLVQIMNYNLNTRKILSSCLALALLISCAVFAGPMSYAEEGTPSSAPEKTVEVSTVDELIAAIAPDTEILLSAGTYDLSTASGYGQYTGNPWCRWEEQYDGPQLALWDVSNLTIRGAGKDETTIAAVPRYASVLSIQNCDHITLSGFTAGHTQEPGFCAGDVLAFGNTKNVNIDACGMFGCGVIGLNAWNCSDFEVTNSEIYSCSYGAVSLAGCRNILMDGCVIRDHASATEPSAAFLFYLDSSESVTVRNSVIRNNYVQNLLTIGYSRDVVFAGNRVEGNRFLSALFVSNRNSPVVEGCSFVDNNIQTWVEGNGVFPVDAAGNKLGKTELEAMTQRTISEGESLIPPRAENTSSVAPSADGAYHVSTVDEFLAAIGNDRTIILEEAMFDLTTASDYGAPGGTYYFWKESYDGPELVITDVHDLTINVNTEAVSDEAAPHYTISAMPRYANVLSFQYCDDIVLTNFTAGHTQEPGECVGGVLFFQNCSNVGIYSCRLYGCGILGIDASNSNTISVVGTEIYDCSQGGAHFWMTNGISFTDCSIHDVDGPALSFFSCGDATWNGNPVAGTEGQYTFAEDGSLINFDWDAFFAEKYPDLNQATTYVEPEEVDPAVALVWARGELKRLQDLGILSREVGFDGELEYAAFTDAYVKEDTGREMNHGFYARDYSGKYMINFRIDDTVTGDVRSVNIEAAADPEEPRNDMQPIVLDGTTYYYYDNFDDIFPADLTLGTLCDRLAAYWGYSGWTLAGTVDTFYGLHTPAPSPDLLVSELPEENYYVTVYFEGDQEGVPMYIQICHLPGRVYFGFGEGHLVG